MTCTTFIFRGLANSVQIAIVGKDVERMESTPTVSRESWTRYFYLSSWDCLAQWSPNPSHISSLFLCWEWSNLAWFPTWKPRRGSSALSCNIDQQALITIITAVLSNVLWACDTSVCFNSPFNFKNKGFNFIFVVLYLHFKFVVFDRKCMLSFPS